MANSHTALAGADNGRQAGLDKKSDHGAGDVCARDDLESEARSRGDGDLRMAAAHWRLQGEGAGSGYLFFDRAANQFLSITIWESEEAQKRNATSPEQIHGRAEFMKHLTGAPIPSNYEVAAVVK